MRAASSVPHWVKQSAGDAVFVDAGSSGLSDERGTDEVAHAQPRIENALLDTFDAPAQSHQHQHSPAVAQSAAECRRKLQSLTPLSLISDQKRSVYVIDGKELYVIDEIHFM